jgi:hypothetical protein
LLVKIHILSWSNVRFLVFCGPLTLNLQLTYNILFCGNNVVVLHRASVDSVVYSGWPVWDANFRGYCSFACAIRFMYALTVVDNCWVVGCGRDETVSCVSDDVVTCGREIGGGWEKSTGEHTLAVVIRKLSCHVGVGPVVFVFFSGDYGHDDIYFN